MNLNQDSFGADSLRQFFGSEGGNVLMAPFPTPGSGGSLSASFGAGSGGVMSFSNTSAAAPSFGGGGMAEQFSRQFSSGDNSAAAVQQQMGKTFMVKAQPGQTGGQVAPTQTSGGMGFSYTAPTLRIGTDGQISSSGGFQFDLPMSTVTGMQNQALDFVSNNSAINRGFLGGIINSGQNAVRGSQQDILDFGKLALGSVENMNAAGLKAQVDITKAKNRGCFITTAICNQSGLPDDCEILQTFRHFRDTFMREHDAAAVLEYYATAPQILARIERRDDGSEILKTLRDRFLMPAFAAIKAGDNERARTLYVVMVIAARGFAE